uniref:nicotinamide/nicotinic acid mononucleotide adenylyltransferase-like n=1 Tax=Erigeron canadensis TaxID=72917 RepID=UPI001CB99EA1|nr:nicotinamide/nicotinic acid mononucleotide adenylyltransferase-like [Erigeron canadensis]
MKKKMVRHVRTQSKYAYKKKGLIPAEHHIAMCQLACKSSEFIMVDSWEANQRSFQRSLTVLSRIRSFFSNNGLVSSAFLNVVLVCGSDLLESFAIAFQWCCTNFQTICRDYGVVCICREGQDIEKIISCDEILTEDKDNIEVVDEIIPNRISSTLVRDCISRNLSVKYLTSDEVIDYIKRNQLYANNAVQQE